MATNLQIDDELIRRAVKLGRHRTKKEAVTRALTDYIHHLEQELAATTQAIVHRAVEWTLGKFGEAQSEQ